MAISTGAVIAGIVLLIILFAAAVMPLLAVQSLRDALVTRDSVRLSELVDPARFRDTSTARTRDYYGPDATAAGAVTDRLLTPTGLIAAICDAGLATPVGPAAPFCPISAPLADLRFASFDRVSAALRRPDGVAATVVLDRSGLRWRLTDIVLAGTVYDRLRAAPQ